MRTAWRADESVLPTRARLACSQACGWQAFSPSRSLPRGYGYFAAIKASGRAIRASADQNDNRIASCAILGSRAAVNWPNCPFT